MSRKKTNFERLVELERLYGADFLPVSRSRLRRRSGGYGDAEARRERAGAPPAKTPRPAEPRPSQAAALAPEFEDFRRRVLECRKCRLCDGRTQVVFGVGTVPAPLMFIGEAPGADEDQQGEPFVGRAGQLLTRSLRKLGVKREDVYIANVLKCRPPGNRSPAPDEIQSCMPYLLTQIRWVNPKVLCALGNIAAQTLLATPLGISRLRGKYHDFMGRRLFATFHPAYVLRNMNQQTLFEADLRTVCTDAGLLSPRDGQRLRE